jgi:hypothetical protein
MAIVHRCTLFAIGFYVHSQLLALPAHAAPKLRDELSAEARLDWDAARELYDAGDYQGALLHFQKTYELSHNPRTLFNIGVCLKSLTRYALAIQAWERELESREQLERADVKKVEAAIEALRPFVSSVTVKVNEPGAVLSIDGTEIGAAPFIEPVAIDVGRRLLRIAKPDFVPLEKTIEVLQNAPVSVSFELRPVKMTATLSLTIDGPLRGALFMDGLEIGVAPFTGEVPVGPHTFEVRAAGFEPARQTSQLVYGNPLRMSLSLVEQHEEGKLRVNVDHADAAISLDGAIVGYGRWEGLLPAGGHQLAVTRPGYETHSAEVSLSRNQERTIPITLEKHQSWVWWTVSLAAAVGGGAIATVLLVRPSDTPAVNGTLNPGLVSF